MKPSTDPVSQQIGTVPAQPVKVLAYAPPPSAKPSVLFLAALTGVAIVNLLLGSLLLFMGLNELAEHSVTIAAGLLITSLLHLLVGVFIWTRTASGWRRCYDLLMLSASICTGLCCVSVLRLWRERYVLVSDESMFVFFVGGLFGSLNFAGAFVLCRAKRAYRADHIDTIWRTRASLLFPVPFILLIAGLVIFFKYYA